MNELTTPVLRFESPEDRPTEFDTLYTATCEPPMEPESRVVLPGGRLLAEADKERCAWVYTATGRLRIAAEMRAERNREVGEEWAEDEKREAIKEASSW